MLTDFPPALLNYSTWHRAHLRTKQFYGISENAAKDRRWIAVSVYVPVDAFSKRLGMEVSLYTLLPVCSATVFKKMSIQSAILPTADGPR